MATREEYDELYGQAAGVPVNQVVLGGTCPEVVKWLG